MLSKVKNVKRKRVIYALIVVVVLFILVKMVTGGGDVAEEEVAPQLRTVELASVATLAGGNTFSVIGTVEAVNESQVESEASGRITSVPVALGNTVSRGQVIAQIENSSERAAVLQAEGSYEAALASAAQSDVGVADAESSLQSAQTAALNTYRSAFTTIDDSIRNTADELFTNPERRVPGLRISGGGRSSAINAERYELGIILEDWARALNSVNSDDALTLMTEATEHTRKALGLMDELSGLVSEAVSDGDSSFSASELSSLTTRFAAARNSLNGTLQSLEASRSAIESATEALDRARLGGTGSDVSAANAAVKQALGSLRAAQATLEKTIIRSPLSGTVNALDVKVGDFVGNAQRVALIANNNALEITTFVGESDRELITLGDTVLIEGSFEGTITNIAPAVNPDTRKVEVKIATEADTLANGDTVRIETIEKNGEEVVVTDGPIRIPLTSVKLTVEDAFVFTVEEGSVLRAHPVELGKANGSVVVIEDGITSDMQIVVDARGLNDGVTVTVKE